MNSPFDVGPGASLGFRSLFGGNEVTPLGRAGQSHFGFVPGDGPGMHSWHSTTQLRGFGEREGLPFGLSIHIGLDDFNQR